MESMETIYESQFKKGAYPFFKKLRQEQPIFPMSQQSDQSTWLVTKYDDVKELLKQPSFIKDQKKLFQTAANQAKSDDVNIFENMMLDVDPPDHTRLRKLVQPFFNPKTIKQLEPRIVEIADQLLAQMEQKSSPVDLIDDYAFPLPIIVISELLGVPSEDRDRFRKWSNTIIAASNEFETDFIEDVEAFTSYLTSLFEERKQHPQDDLITKLLQAEEEGEQLSKDELYSMVVLLIIAGHETTVNLIANTMYALFQHPDQLKKLKDDPSLVEPAIEEGLRYYSPVDFSTARWAQEDMAFHGQTIRRGDLVLASISSANRDEDKFENPSQLDITRSRNAHIAFGYGIHFCLGAPLARLEGKIALERLLSTFPQIHLSENNPEWRTVFLLRGLEHLQIQTKS
ncbi:cytochrome P450 [Halobacillus andaensis]|uniref:Cytochrome P450 n=1 Tax=Halobacillus andaensis TaxID=1176239 RepID=A0A917B4U2_HALAA|nr:cytochrome P450 [Halobacillus andaensis]MBP2004798.1 cytochrome P450 [Halobacillus andaensis]GGF18798.1 cytochrome P450 [Halobacillus andaensis]